MNLDFILGLATGAVALGSGQFAWRTLREIKRRERQAFNPLQDFLAGRCWCAASESIPDAELYWAYSVWAKANKLPVAERLLKRPFRQALMGMGFKPFRNETGRHWRGLRLLAFTPGEIIPRHGSLGAPQCPPPGIK